MYSLKALSSRYNIKDAVLKMDCEGCQYYQLRENSSVLRKFKMMQIEYNYGHEKPVERLKSKDFSVKFTEPKRSFNSSAGKEMLSSYIYFKFPGELKYKDHLHASKTT